MNPARFPWWDGFAGLLVSPNRGLFIFAPWTIFAVWGAARIWKENLYGWGRYLILGMIGVYVVHARLGIWWGGGCYGPRYMTDLLPFLAFFLVPIWPRIRFSPLAAATFVLAVFVSFWIQIVGAYYYSNGNWDYSPQTVEQDPGRVWDWSDTQIMRTWRAGAARPEILYEFPLFIDAILSESDKPRIRVALIGLERERVWDQLKDIGREPAADLVSISDAQPELLARARAMAPAQVKLYADYLKMLDEMKPAAVLVNSATERHLEIVRECARRHIDVSVEQPMAANAMEAREMESLATAAKIKLMVNFGNAWVGPNQDLHGRIRGDGLGPVQKIMVQYGHAVRRESDSSKTPAAPHYNPPKDSGALVDFGSYGAELALWMGGRPLSVFAYSQIFNTDPANPVGDDAVLLLNYPSAAATIEASRNWPYEKSQVEVVGPKGSMLATEDSLFFRPAHTPERLEVPEGFPLEVRLSMHETSSAIAYFVYHIRHDQPIEDPVSARMNVEVMEILDAAKESIRTGRAVQLSRK